MFDILVIYLSANSKTWRTYFSKKEVKIFFFNFLLRFLLWTVLFMYCIASNIDQADFSLWRS